MKTRPTVGVSTVLLGVLLFLGALPSGHTHHGFTNHFDPYGEITIEGTVTEYRFINPHVLIHVDVETDQGDVEEWLVESSGISTFLREGGLSSASLKPGDHVKVVGHPSRFPDSSMRLKVLVLPNGDEVSRTSPFQPIPFAEEQ